MKTSQEKINENEKLIAFNQKASYLLGIASSIIDNCKHADDKTKENIKWFNQCIENLIYLDKPLPPAPKG